MVKGLGFRISQYLFSQFKLFSCLGSTCLHVIDHTCIWKPQQQYRWKLKMNEWFKIIAMSTYMFNTTKGVGQSFGLRRIGWLVSMPTFELYGFKGTIFPPHSPPKLVPNVPNHIHSLRRFIKIFVSNGVPNFVHHASVIISRENNIQMSTMLLKTAWCEKNDQKLVFMLLYFVFFLVICSHKLFLWWNLLDVKGHHFTLQAPPRHSRLVPALLARLGFSTHARLSTHAHLPTRTWLSTFTHVLDSPTNSRLPPALMNCPWTPECSFSKANIAFKMFYNRSATGRQGFFFFFFLNFAK
jgi:hypothetical protein